MYADETGDLDMTGASGTSRYFGFGTAVFVDSHGQELWDGMRLRCHLEQQGIRLPGGMHAKNDSRATREEVFDLIRRQAPRFDTTFLLKSRAYPGVREAVHGHDKVPTGGQVEVPAGGHLVVPGA